MTVTGKGGRPKSNPQFELYVWLLVELLRDRRPPLSRHSELKACDLLRKTLGVDWSNDTIKTHCKRVKARMDEGGTERRLLSGLRQWREQQNWPEPIDLVVAVDREWRRFSTAG